jgi:putative nucleotidyltransferase with HDIG domain
MPKPRILFVDDETMLLMGLQRNLRRMRDQWDTEFVTSGAAALEAMARSRFDVIVTDMCMPEMSGSQLLERVSAQYPQTLRFILSGQCDRDATLRIVNSAHQFLAKPCDLGELCQRLTNSLALRDIVENPRLKQVLLQVNSLPTMPAVYCDLLATLESPHASAQLLAEIIQRDMALTSKMLQMVNSAFFGLGHHVANPAYAITLLGTEVVKSLVLSFDIFSQLNNHQLHPDLGENLMSHSIMVSRMSQRAAQLGGADAAMIDDSFTAGLLHDIGELILASELNAEYTEIAKLAATENISSLSAEFKVLGCSHAEIGAYLLATWGLPIHIVEAVAWHHLPSASPVSQPFPLLAVHIAECVSTGLRPNMQDDLGIDHTFIERCGLEDRGTLLENACSGLMIKV